MTSIREEFDEQNMNLSGGALEAMMRFKPDLFVTTQDSMIRIMCFETPLQVFRAKRTYD